MVHYYCRHCEIELGMLPLKLAEESLSFIMKLDEEDGGFITHEKDGTFTVHAICEQCEQTLLQSPHYYTLEKWLQ